MNSTNRSQTKIQIRCSLVSVKLWKQTKTAAIFQSLIKTLGTKAFLWMDDKRKHRNVDWTSFSCSFFAFKQIHPLKLITFIFDQAIFKSYPLLDLDPQTWRILWTAGWRSCHPSNSVKVLQPLFWLTVKLQTQYQQCSSMVFFENR